MKPELLPCPFCGGSKMTTDVGYVACLDCNAFGSTEGLDGAPVGTAWNRRAIPQAAQPVAPNDAPDQLTAAYQLGELLAIIHRDGGHYVIEHGWKKAVDDAHTILAAQPAGAAQVPALRAALVGLLEIEDARIGTGAFRPNEAAQQRIDAARAAIAAPAPTEGVPVAWPNSVIRKVLLAHGFTTKPGHTDLKPYVYEAAHALMTLAVQVKTIGDKHSALSDAHEMSMAERNRMSIAMQIGVSPQPAAAPVDALREHLEWMVAWFTAPDETTTERFERVATAFHAETGYVAPGKDCRLHSPESRREVWSRWMDEHIAAARAALTTKLAAPEMESKS